SASARPAVLRLTFDLCLVFVLGTKDHLQSLKGVENPPPKSSTILLYCLISSKASSSLILRVNFLMVSAWRSTNSINSQHALEHLVCLFSLILLHIPHLKFHQ